MGTESLCLVLVDPLDLGHYVYSSPARLRLSCGAETSSCSSGRSYQGCAPTGARFSHLDSLRNTFWYRCARQSHDAGVPSLLRVVDLAAAIPASLAFSGRHSAFVSHFLCRAV